MAAVVAGQALVLVPPEVLRPDWRVRTAQAQVRARLRVRILIGRLADSPVVPGVRACCTR